MKQGLFESLQGKFSDGLTLEEIPQDKKQSKSIGDNLVRLFNARAGMLSHLPDYGLPDISEICRSYPAGLDRLRIAMQKAVAKYEPRLKKCRVELIDNDSTGSQIRFRVSGETNTNEKVTYRTTFREQSVPDIEEVPRRY